MHARRSRSTEFEHLCCYSVFKIYVHTLYQLNALDPSANRSIASQSTRGPALERRFGLRKIALIVVAIDQSQSPVAPGLLASLLRAGPFDSIHFAV